MLRWGCLGLAFGDIFKDSFKEIFTFLFAVDII